MKKKEQKTSDSAPGNKYPPSINAGHPDVRRFPSHWPRKAFRDLLVPAMRPIVLADDREYQLIVAKRNRGGIAPRERLLGKQVLTADQYTIRTGDFVIAKRQISHGACGFVPAHLDGAIVSGEYDVFRVKKGLLPGFLDVFTHTPYFQQTCFHSSIGVAVEKLIFKTEKWLNFEMPVPPVEDQRKIVAAVEAAGQYVASMEKLIAAKREFKRGVMGKVLAARGHHWRSAALSEVVGLVSEKVAPSPSNIRRCVELEHLESETSRRIGETTTREAISLKAPFQRGDVLFGKLRPYLRKHWLADFEGVCTTEIWVLRSVLEEISPEFLFLLVQSEEFQRMANITSGSKMPRADWDVVGEMPVALPSLKEQTKISRVFSLLDRELECLESLAAQTRLYKRGLMQRLLSTQD